MSSIQKSLPHTCGAPPLARTSIQNSLLLPAFSVASYLCQFTIPAGPVRLFPQVEFGISPVFLKAITVLLLDTKRTRKLGFSASP